MWCCDWGSPNVWPKVTKSEMNLGSNSAASHHLILQEMNFSSGVDGSWNRLGSRWEALLVLAKGNSVSTSCLLLFLLLLSAAPPSAVRDGLQCLNKESWLQEQRRLLLLLPLQLFLLLLLWLFLQWLLLLLLQLLLLLLRQMEKIASLPILTLIYQLCSLTKMAPSDQRFRV